MRTEPETIDQLALQLDDSAMRARDLSGGLNHWSALAIDNAALMAEDAAAALRSVADVLRAPYCTDVGESDHD